MRCDLKLTLSYTYINLRREERKGETHGLRQDERYDQRGEGETGRGGRRGWRGCGVREGGREGGRLANKNLHKATKKETTTNGPQIQREWQRGSRKRGQK